MCETLFIFRLLWAIFVHDYQVVSWSGICFSLLVLNSCLFLSIAILYWFQYCVLCAQKKIDIRIDQTYKHKWCETFLELPVISSRWTQIGSWVERNYYNKIILTRFFWRNRSRHNFIFLLPSHSTFKAVLNIRRQMCGYHRQLWNFWCIGISLYVKYIFIWYGYVCKTKLFPSCKVL